MPPADRRVIKVRLLDREYAFASQGDEVDERVKQVARLVDEKMQEMRRASPRLTPMQTAVLAGLDLVDELLRMRQDVSSVEEDISLRANRLTESLGQLLRGVDAVAVTTVQDQAQETDSGADR